MENLTFKAREDVEVLVDIWSQGYNAGASESNVSPYPYGTMESGAWTAGYYCNKKGGTGVGEG